MPPAKEKMIRILQQQPDDAAYDDLLVKLASARKVHRGFIESGSNRSGEPFQPRRPVRLWT